MRLRSYSVPEFLQFETTYSCNSHCLFCYNPSRNHLHNPELTWELVQRIGEAHVPLVQLTGGEVSLLLDLNLCIDHLSRTSKVSIVTNGIKRLDITRELAKIFLSLHGNRETHEKITNNPKTYDKIIANIREYVRQGFPVAADVILCSENYHQMYELIGTAADLGMVEVFINRFQSGGIGVAASDWLMPPVEMFRRALDKILRARNDFGMSIIFGTAIPLCIDKRLLMENLFANCNMGTSFATIAPNGDLRLCNQALKSYGNILNSPLPELWQDPRLGDYRDLRWVTGVCRECPLLEVCGTGCRVDNSQAADYCPDVFVRHLEKLPDVVEELVEWMNTQESTPLGLYNAHLPVEAEANLLFIDVHPEKYIVRNNYSCITVEEVVFNLVLSASRGVNNPSVLLKQALQQFPHLQAKHFTTIMDYLLMLGLLQHSSGINASYMRHL